MKRLLRQFEIKVTSDAFEKVTSDAFCCLSNNIFLTNVQVTLKFQEAVLPISIRIVDFCCLLNLVENCDFVWVAILTLGGAGK